MHSLDQIKAKPQQLPDVTTDHLHQGEKEESHYAIPLPGITNKKAENKLQNPCTGGQTTGTNAHLISQLTHSFSRIPLYPLTPLNIQPKLSVNTPGDEYEQEADEVADKIMRMPGTMPARIQTGLPNIIHRKCETCGKEIGKEKKENEEGRAPFGGSLIQRKCAACKKEEEEKKRLQRKESGNNTVAASANVYQVIQSQGQSMDQSTRSFMESRFGFDFGKVQIHNDSLAHQSAKEINALAYTHQHHIAFGAGQYQPQTESGRKLLAHELTHTIQQDNNVVRRVVKITPPQTTPARFIVEDDTSPAAGEMTKSQFMTVLNEAVCNAVDEELRGTRYSSDNCPYIRAIFARQADSSAEQVEQLIRQYEPRSSGAGSAAELIQVIIARVRVAVNQWKRRGSLEDVTGDISGMMAAISLGPRGAGNTGTAGGPAMQLKEQPGGATDKQSPQAVMQSLGKGNALDSNTKGRMERVFGTAFGDVEVHTDNHAANLASSMNARAFAVGNHIAFASGEHKPGTLIGDALMAHELAHVVQQGDGRADALQEKGGTEYSALEEDADISATGAVLSLLGGFKGDLKHIGKNAMPRLRSGLQLQRCDAGIGEVALASALIFSLETAEVGTAAVVVAEGTTITLVEGAVVAEGVTVAAPATIAVTEAVVVAPAAAPAVLSAPAAAVVSAPTVSAAQVVAGTVIATTLSGDTPTSTSEPEDESEPEEPCQVFPLGYHRGGDIRHNNCADVVPPNFYPGSDIEVVHKGLGRKSFDALDALGNTLWEVKTEAYSTYSPFLQDITMANALADIARELPLALACGYGYVFGVTDSGFFNELLLQVPLGVDLRLIDC